MEQGRVTVSFVILTTKSGNMEAGCELKASKVIVKYSHLKSMKTFTGQQILKHFKTTE